MTILVTGGSGHVGSAVVKELKKRGAKVRILVRKEGTPAPEGVEVAVGDLLDPISVHEALAGVSKLYLLNAVTPDELTQGLIAYDLAKKLKHDYLPPSARINPFPEKSTRHPNSPAEPPAETSHVDKPRQRQASTPRRMEGKKIERFSRYRTAQTSEPQPDDIWLGFRRPQFRSEEPSRSSTLRTASCLACLTRPDADCRNICP
jgi:hypothetical protein